MSASRKKSETGTGNAVDEKKLIEKALKKIEGKLDTEEIKGSVGDLLRLLEFRKQLEEDEPKDVTVTWIEDKSSE